MSLVSAEEVPRGKNCWTPDVTRISPCTCSVQVLKIQKPRTTEPGSPTSFTVTYQLKAGKLDKCKFLLEGSIIPKSSAMSMYPLSISTGTSKCCQQNDNYAATYETVDNYGGTEAKTRTVDVKFNVKAPEDGMIDHCTSGHPSYWEGEGYYDVFAGAYNGCYDDLKDDFVPYTQNRQADVYIAGEEDEDGGDGIDIIPTQDKVKNWLHNNILLVGAIAFLVFASAYVYYQKR